MSDRQTHFRTDSTNHQSHADPNSQQDSLLGEGPPSLDTEMKNQNMFQSPAPCSNMVNTPIIPQLNCGMERRSIL